MNKKKLLLYAVLILSWLSLIKLDRPTIKRYFPVGTFTALLFTLLSEVNRSMKWWKVKERIFPKLPGNFPFALGPFVTLPIWIFKLSYGKFWLYLICNVFTGYMFAYPITNLFEKLNIYKMKKMTRVQLFFLSVSASIVIYIYQFLIDDEL